MTIDFFTFFEVAVAERSFINKTFFNPIKLEEYRKLFREYAQELVEEGIENQFIYSISLLYCFFFAFSAIILFALIQIRQQNINNVGYTFLLLTSIKMAGAYFFLKPILNSHSGAAKIEKFHFFGIFILFLIIETIMSIKILNTKQ